LTGGGSMLRKISLTIFVLMMLCLGFSEPVIQPVTQNVNVNVLAHSVDQTFPESLYKSVGTKTFNVQYIKLFADKEQKSYIIKAWYFQPGNSTMNYQIRIVDEKAKKEFVYSFPGVRSTTYIRLEPVLVICPVSFKVYVNNQQIPDEVISSKDGEDSLGLIGLPSDVGGAMLRILTRTESGYKDISEGTAVSKNDEILLQIVAGTFPTGGYRIELDDPDIVYPVTGKRGKITITGKFHKPGKGDYVTQAFTTPSETVQIGKLPGGEYDIIAVIEGLGQLMRTLIVK